MFVRLAKHPPSARGQGAVGLEPCYAAIRTLVCSNLPPLLGGEEEGCGPGRGVVWCSAVHCGAVQCSVVQ